MTLMTVFKNGASDKRENEKERLNLVIQVWNFTSRKLKVTENFNLKIIFVDWTIFTSLKKSVVSIFLLTFKHTAVCNEK